MREYLQGAELLITDWSGVMSDDRLPVYEANARLLEGFGLPRTTFQEWLDLSHSSAYAFLNSQGVAGTEEELTRLYVTVYGQVCSEGVGSIVYEDAHNFLKTLQELDKEIVVVSSHPQEHLVAEADRYGLTPFIDSFMGSHADKVPAIKSLLGQTDIQAWYLGDTIYDIHAARKANVPIVSITTGYHPHQKLKDENPDLIVHSLTELLEHVR